MMEDLLTPVSTSYRPSDHSGGDALIEVQKPANQAPRTFTADPSTANDALEALRGQPDFETVRSVLQFLGLGIEGKSTFSIKHPSPASAQLVNVLVSETIPNYWSIFNERSSSSSKKKIEHAAERKLLLSSLRSISGLNALLARLKACIQETNEVKGKEGLNRVSALLKDYLAVLESLLQGDFLVELLWKDLGSESPPRRKALWHEIVFLLAGGKLISTVAEASGLIKESSSSLEITPWIADGAMYSKWLGRNIVHWVRLTSAASGETLKSISELLGKGSRMGYADAILEEILGMILGSDDDKASLTRLVGAMPTYEQKPVLGGALKLLSKHFSSNSEPSNSSKASQDASSLVTAAAGYLRCLIADDKTRKDYFISWLTSSSGAGVGEGIGIRRAVLAALSKSKDDLEAVFEKSLHQFGDQLYIRHAPILQQEVHAQVLLLTAGYIRRNSPLKLAMAMKTGPYLNAISNRLAASSEKARFLGMVVGEAMSALSDKPENRMKFKIEELESSEAMWYKSLTQISDTIGSLEPLKSGAAFHISMKPVSLKKTTEKATRKAPVKASNPQSGSKIIAIEELSDNYEDSDDNDLVPYAKPDSDAEDSDEDPTLIQRNKPIAPVYIRDLIVYLRDTENYDRHKLALNTAHSLIRRKANFGMEVTDHVEELATLLVGLQDKFDIENFQDMRVQGMIAVLLAQPKKMAPWFAKTFFDGDLSLSQRASILTVLSVSARELGGLKEQDSSLTALKNPPPDSFPTKRLPPRLHKVYASEQQHHHAIDSLSSELANTMIQPIAASLADTATGPDILKVRTFSSRLAVESRRKPATVNILSAIVASSFFFPLTGRFSAHFKAYGAGNVVFAPFLLSSFLKTLSLILHASGTSTLELQQMTSEFWDLLLNTRTQAQKERAVGQAILFGFMTILEMNEDKRRLVEAHGREITETQRWVDMYFRSLGSGSEEDDKIRSLAAGVLLRIREVVEKYQALLMGNLSSF